MSGSQIGGRQFLLKLVVIVIERDRGPERHGGFCPGGERLRVVTADGLGLEAFLDIELEGVLVVAEDLVIADGLQELVVTQFLGVDVDTIMGQPIKRDHTEKDRDEDQRSPIEIGISTGPGPRRFVVFGGAIIGIHCSQSGRTRRFLTHTNPSDYHGVQTLAIWGGESRVPSESVGLMPIRLEFRRMILFPVRPTLPVRRSIPGTSAGKAPLAPRDPSAASRPPQDRARHTPAADAREPGSE